MAIYDCFMYFDEDLLLDLRLHTLDAYVDYFVIAEATRDHQGRPKPLQFDIKHFASFQHKIRYIVVDDMPREIKAGKHWMSWPGHVRDQFQRDALARGYQDAKDHDWIMISDLDEIPRPESIALFRPECRYAILYQQSYTYHFNRWVYTLAHADQSTRICVKKYLKSPSWLRYIKGRRPGSWKFYKPKPLQRIADGGWHFGYLKSPKDIKRKIESFAHAECNTLSASNETVIAQKIKDGEDLHGYGHHSKIVPMDHTFPAHMVNNLHKYKAFIA